MVMGRIKNNKNWNVHQVPGGQQWGLKRGHLVQVVGEEQQQQQ